MSISNHGIRRFARLAGLLQLIIAFILILLAMSLPSRKQIEQSLTSAEDMARIAVVQVDALDGRLDHVTGGGKAVAAALHSLASTFENVATMTYPSIRWDGLSSSIERRPLWPGGSERSHEFRNVAAAAQASVDQLEDFSKELPAIKTNLVVAQQALNQYAGQTAQVMGYTRMLLFIVAALVGVSGLQALMQAKSMGREQRNE